MTIEYQNEPEQDRALDPVTPGVHRCLRCDSANTIAQDKAVHAANTCYRCRTCGHIFSPPQALVQKAW